MLSLTIQNKGGGRRKGGVARESMEHDILMLTKSSYYDLKFGKLPSWIEMFTSIQTIIFPRHGFKKKMQNALLANTEHQA